MKYSALIRKLVEASVYARQQKYDIAEKLRARCTQEKDLVRQTLMNAVCDPRFRMHVNSVSGWSRKVRERLERFADRLQRIDGLTEEMALSEMDEMLAEWFDEVMCYVERSDREELFSLPMNPISGSLKDAIDDFLAGISGDSERETTSHSWSGEVVKDLIGYEENTIDEDSDSNRKGFVIIDEGQPEQNAVEVSTGVDNDIDEIDAESCNKDDADDNERENDEGVVLQHTSGDDDADSMINTDSGDSEDIEKGDNEDRRMTDTDTDDSDDSENENEDSGDDEDDKEDIEKEDTVGDLGLINGRKGPQVQVENSFLKRVPPTLIDLARRIGRSVNAEGNPKGNFLKASKSDIAGITTGNDLGCMLPSELAMMADARTENIFFKNYVTRSLQLFASASRSDSSKIHRDGPIIICLDTSASMDGEPMLVAIALTFAVCIIAQRRKRPVIVVKYAHTFEPFFIRNLETQRRKLIDFLSVVEAGGNNEDGLFRWLFTELLPQRDEYKNGDVLCISDFGWIPISEEVMNIVIEEKKRNMRFYGLNIINERFDDVSSSRHIGLEQRLLNVKRRNEAPYSPFDVCDSLWEYSNGICKEMNI